MIKRIVFLSMLLVSSWSLMLTEASDGISDAIYLVVDDLNEYLLNPIDLNDENVDWSWAVVAGEDFAQGCRDRDDSLLPITDVFYDVHIYRLSETYYYRVSMDERLMIPCLPLPDVPENVLPQLVDALADLNRRLHMQFTPNDIPWTWTEQQFEDYTLGCGAESAQDSKYDRRTNGYVIEFTVQGTTWEYRVSSDRLVVILCSPSN